MYDWHDGLDWPTSGLGRALMWLGMKVLLFGGFLLIAGISFAYATDCSQTVSTASTAVPFPTTGSGPPQPTTFFQICNAHATQNLGVNITGGTAAINAQGTLTLTPGGCFWLNQTPLPIKPTVVGSGINTTTACWYK